MKKFITYKIQRQQTIENVCDIYDKAWSSFFLATPTNTEDPEPGIEHIKKPTPLH